MTEFPPCRFLQGAKNMELSDAKKQIQAIRSEINGFRGSL